MNGTAYASARRQYPWRHLSETTPPERNHAPSGPIGEAEMLDPIPRTFP